MNENETYIQSVGGLTWTQHDLSSLTLVDANGVYKASASTLGLVSTIVADQNNGSLADSGVDPAYWTVNVGGPPSGATALMVRVICGTFPTEDPGGSYSQLSAGVKPTGTMTATQGYHLGMNQDNNALMKIRGPQRIGANGSVGSRMTSAPAYADLIIPITNSTATQAYGILRDSASPPVTGFSVQGTASAGTYGTVDAILALSNGGTPPVSDVTWAGVEFWTGWLLPV